MLKKFQVVHCSSTLLLQQYMYTHIIETEVLCYILTSLSSFCLYRFGKAIPMEPAYISQDGHLRAERSTGRHGHRCPLDRVDAESPYAVFLVEWNPWYFQQREWHVSFWEEKRSPFGCFFFLDCQSRPVGFITKLKLCSSTHPDQHMFKLALSKQGFDIIVMAHMALEQHTSQL